MTVHYTDESVTLHHGDALDVLRELPDSSIDAVVTDPPYGIRFMGQAWDGADIESRTARGRETTPMPEGVGGPNGGYRSAATEAGRYDLRPSANQAFQLWCTDWATECLRVLKPGGHLVSFGGSRTWHRLAAAVEDAGFEIRDSIAWLYGSGFPKSRDISKAIDTAAGVTREVVGSMSAGASSLHRHSRVEHGYRDQLTDVTPDSIDITAPTTELAQQWAGWGTALKPSFEPIVVGRKPFVGPVSTNVLVHGTGALNVDGTRIATTDVLHSGGSPVLRHGGANHRPHHDTAVRVPSRQHEAGRWPTNVLLDEDQAAELDAQTGVLTSGKLQPHHADHGKDAGTLGAMAGAPGRESYGDSGGASRISPVFRYEANAPASERPRVNGVSHPTVKPIALMRWLIRLVTPPGGTVLEPFAGSGTTVEACIQEGMRCIAIERGAEYLPLIQSRIDRHRNPTAHLAANAEDLGLFGLIDGEAS